MIGHTVEGSTRFAESLRWSHIIDGSRVHISRHARTWTWWMPETVGNTFPEKVKTADAVQLFDLGLGRD